MVGLLSFVLVLIESQTLSAHATKTVVIVGDSLTAGPGVPAGETYPSRLRAKIAAAGLPWEIVVDGVNGSLSASGADRVRAALPRKPSLIVLALGGNDGLRQIPLPTVEANLARALAVAREAGVPTLLAGLRPPPGFAPDFAMRVDQMFTRLAKTYGATLLPSMLEGVVGVDGFNLADGIHPNAAGHAIIADLVFAAMRPLLE